jgi:glycosyltransferase involved in cell wall biosynthesis
VIVPTFEEASRVATTVRRLRDELADLQSHGGLEIVVVDDGSSDATAEIARAAGADRVVVQPENHGKGAAVRAGMAVARGRTLAFTDADLAYAPAQLLTLVLAVEDGWDVVVGSRKHTETTTLVRARRLREIGGRVINLLTHVVLLGQYRDTQCGLKAFRSDVAHLLFSKARIDGFAFDVELFHLVERYRLSLTEVSVTVENSTRSTVRVVRDATRLVRDLIRVRRGAARGWYEPAPGELESLSPAGPSNVRH